MFADLNWRKYKGNRGAGQYLVGRDGPADGDPAWVAGPWGKFAACGLGEDRGLAGDDIGGGDGQRVDEAAPEVALDIIDGQFALDKIAEKTRVEQAAVVGVFEVRVAYLSADQAA